MNSLLDYFRKIKMASGGLYIVLGLLMTFMPSLSKDIVCAVVGVLLIVNGITIIMNYIKEQLSGIFGVEIIVAVGMIILGFMFVFSPNRFFAYLLYVVGLLLIIEGIQDIVRSFSLSKQGYTSSNQLIIRGVFLIVAGLFVLANPIGIVDTMIRILGIILLIDGLSDFMTGKKIKDFLG